MLTTQTVRVLNNFSKINNRIEFMPGKEVRVLSPYRNIFGNAILNQTITKTFAIDDMQEFLRLWRRVSSKVSKPQVAWDDGGTESDNVLDQLGKHPAIILKNFTETRKYLTDDIRNKLIYEKGITLSEEDIGIRFVLSPVIMKDIVRRAEALSLTFVSVVGKTLVVHHGYLNHNRVVFDLPQMESEDEESEDEESEAARFSIRHLQMMLPLYYQADISRKGIARFRSLNKNLNVTYVMTQEQIEE